MPRQKLKVLLLKALGPGVKRMLLSFTTKNLCTADSMSLSQKYSKQNLTHRETNLEPTVAIKLSLLLIDMVFQSRKK